VPSDSPYQTRYNEVETTGTGGAGPPSNIKVMARGVAMAASLVLASLLLVRRAQRRSTG